MSDNQLKLYVISIMAFCPLQDSENEAIKSLANHQPFLVAGKTMEAVAEVVKQFALNLMNNNYSIREIKKAA